MTRNEVEMAERLSLRRARIGLALGTAFIAASPQFYGMEPDNSVFGMIVHGLWLTWAAALLAIILIDGNPWGRKSVLSLMNDESTRAHRAQAFYTAFISVMGTAIFIFALSYFKDVLVRDAMRLIISVGVASAIICFCTLELKALRDE